MAHLVETIIPLLLTLLLSSALAELVWEITGSWNYAGGTWFVTLYALAPVMAWLLDRGAPPPNPGDHLG
jgi:hypothetical protein